MDGQGLLFAAIWGGALLLWLAFLAFYDGLRRPLRRDEIDAFLATLGPRWTTRIIVLDEPLVRRGPFRFLRHPNHTLLVAEIAVAPMVLGLVWVAVVFSILNALVLWVRIRAENAALASLRPLA